MKSELLWRGCWAKLQDMHPWAFVCSYCGNQVSASKGYKLAAKSDGSGDQYGGVFICPHCQAATIGYPMDRRVPDAPMGHYVNHVPADLTSLYNEARTCTGSGAFTAAVLLCRKILMHIGVEQGAEEGKPFVDYVEHLANAGYIPPNGKRWVDHIRKKGNEANHEIREMAREDAEELITFIEMLLRFIYEFPKLGPPAPACSDEEPEGT